MKLYFALLIACLLSASVAAAAAASPSPSPNIVYILADDLGYGDVQCLNPQRGKIKTPHLDRLASQGMIFTDAHSVLDRRGLSQRYYSPPFMPH